MIYLFKYQVVKYAELIQKLENDECLMLVKKFGEKKLE